MCIAVNDESESECVKEYFKHFSYYYTQMNNFVQSVTVTYCGFRHFSCTKIVFFFSKATAMTRYLYFNIVNGKAMEVHQITGQCPEIIISMRISPLSSLPAISAIF